MTRARVLPPPGSHGGDGAAIAAALGIEPSQVVDLSASMNPFAPDAAAIVTAALHRDPGIVTRYPDATAATAALAEMLDVDRELLVVTNGAAEAIALVAADVGAANVVEPEFSLYRRHLPRVDDSAPRWRSNPSNPLGELATSEDRAGVWDEAFYALATGQWTRGDADTWRIGSLTKVWDCPGLRLGYAIAPSADAAERIRSRQPAWAVSGLAAAVVPEFIACTDIAAWARDIADLRRSFVAALEHRGFTVRDTDVNWVLVERPGLRDALAEHGVVVRDCASFGLDGVYRVALPRPHLLERVLAAFDAAGR